MKSTTEVEILRDTVRDIPVCLIIPPSPFLADERVFPSLGILKVAAELQKNGNRVEVLDLSGCKNFIELLSDYVVSSNINHYGITSTTPQLPSSVELSQVIKNHKRDSMVILGGPHVTLSHTALKNEERRLAKGRATTAFASLVHLFDRLVIGDGELAIFEALDDTKNNKIIDASSLSSDLFLKRGQLDHFSPPNRDLIDLDSYHYHIDGMRAFSVISQLGCPFECGFCGGRNSQVFRLTRTRSVGNVVDEVRDVVQGYSSKGIKFNGVMFYDDELNVSPRSLEDLCIQLTELQRELDIEMRFRGFVKAELFTSEQALLMYQAGFRDILSGVESGSDLMLRTMKKHTSRAINTRCLKIAQDAGLKFKALMSIGHPGESEETIIDSIDWVMTNKPDEVDWTVITEYPGSPYYDESTFDYGSQAWVYTEVKTGNRLFSAETDFVTEAEYYKGIPGFYRSYVWTDYLRPERLVELRDYAEQITRKGLNLPDITVSPARQYDHSMGQGLNSSLLRSAN